MQIFDNLLKISDDFDIYIFDIYGVLWNGNGFYDGVLDVMKKLMDEGKVVYILSNTTQTMSDAIVSNEKKGMLKGIHYMELLTSGEIARQYLLSGKLAFENNSNPIKYWNFGTPNKKLFDGTKYVNVENVKEADFIYISIPQLSEDEKSSLPQYADEIFSSKLPKEGEAARFDSTVIDVFIPKLEELMKLNIPAFNANPDLTAAEGNKNTDDIHFVIRQGSIAKQYEILGGEVIEMGKPHKYTYDFLFDLLKQNGIQVDKSRVCMIGDTIRTDIRGGNLAGVKTVLCVETGVVANKIFKNSIVDFIELERLKNAEGGVPDYLIKAVSGS